jgi:hypothetical protein
MNKENKNNDTLSHQIASESSSQIQMQIQPQSQSQFVENVKKWVLLDSQLKIVNEKTKKMREYKSQLGTEIIQYMEMKNKLNTRIQITDGELSFYSKKDYAPLTFSYIEKCLAEIITDKSQVDFILEYLKTNRNIKNTTEIKRSQK